MPLRTKYLQQLDELTDSIRRLGEKTAADARATGLAVAGDEGAAEGVLMGDKAERKLRGAIEGVCLDIMLMQQPLVADDLRFVSGSFRLVSDLTHIDSMTRDVAYFAKFLPIDVVDKLEGRLAKAAEIVAQMVETSVEAFLTCDLDKVQEVIELDDKIDKAYRKAEKSIMDMIRKSDPEELPVAHLPELLMVAKYYERMGDDAQRAAMWAAYRVTGEHEVYSQYLNEGSEDAGDADK